MSLFLTSGHELRSGWKFAGYAIIFLLLWFAMAVALSMAFAESSLLEDRLFVLALNAAALLVPAALSLWIMARVADRKPVSFFGVGLHEGWSGHLLWGITISGGMLMVLVAGVAAIGRLDMEWTASQNSGARLVATATVLLVSAANEELVFRGYPLQVLMRGMGIWPAVALMSLLFGLLHASNPNATHLGTLNTALAGIMLSMAYLKTRSLWLPYGIHIGWNLGLGFVFGFSLSGVDIASLWTARASGSPVIVGGAYGPEGGLLASLVFVAAARAVRSAPIRGAN
jgi:membrane protease YdiL (CAAX protease family)